MQSVTGKHLANFSYWAESDLVDFRSRMKAQAPTLYEYINSHPRIQQWDFHVLSGIIAKTNPHFVQYAKDVLKKGWTVLSSLAGKHMDVLEHATARSGVFGLYESTGAVFGPTANDKAYKWPAVSRNVQDMTTKIASEQARAKAEKESTAAAVPPPSTSSKSKKSKGKRVYKSAEFIDDEAEEDNDFVSVDEDEEDDIPKAPRRGKKRPAVDEDVDMEEAEAGESDAESIEIVTKTPGKVKMISYEQAGVSNASAANRVVARQDPVKAKTNYSQSSKRQRLDSEALSKIGSAVQNQKDIVAAFNEAAKLYGDICEKGKGSVDYLRDTEKLYLRELHELSVNLNFSVTRFNDLKIRAMSLMYELDQADQAPSAEFKAQFGTS